MSTLPPPYPNSYWVQPGRLLAGEYPGAFMPTMARRKLRLLLDAGVTFFLDLTHPADGLEPYTDLLQAEAKAFPTPVTYRRMAIPDRDIPTATQMVETLNVIDEALAAGQVVYIHCWGGIGRTGTVVGCYLARHCDKPTGRGDAALAQLAELWQTVEKRDRHPRSPETSAQVHMVRVWAEAVN
ncbi:MAG: hypothetical protein DYG89_52670 [Caldilinea sp. CFX5]|nr:hypothetical protein [Caldilinea sp. CFX5]